MVGSRPSWARWHIVDISVQVHVGRRSEWRYLLTTERARERERERESHKQDHPPLWFLFAETFQTSMFACWWPIMLNSSADLVEESRIALKVRLWTWTWWSLHPTVHISTGGHFTGPQDGHSDAIAFGLCVQMARCPQKLPVLSWKVFRSWHVVCGSPVTLRRGGQESAGARRGRSPKRVLF